MADGMGMRVSLIGALRNAADALDAFDQHLGGEDAEDENSDLIYEHQPRMMAYVLRETAGHIEQVKADPKLLDEFLTLYCMKPSTTQAAHRPAHSPSREDDIQRD